MYRPIERPVDLYYYYSSRAMAQNVVSRTASYRPSGQNRLCYNACIF